MSNPNERQLRDRHAARAARLAEREAACWQEYLSATRRAGGSVYEQFEVLAWRRLLRCRAGFAAERRHLALELDWALAQLHGYRRAS
jgi:hypothetical protein